VYLIVQFSRTLIFASHQAIGNKDRLRSNINCVGWGTVKLYSLARSLPYPSYRRKRNTVFPLDTGSDAEEDPDVDDESAESASKNFSHGQQQLREAEERDLAENSIESAGPLQVAADRRGVPNFVAARSADPGENYFRLPDVAETPFPAESAHAPYDADAHEEGELNFDVEESVDTSVQVRNGVETNHDENSEMNALSSPNCSIVVPTTVNSVSTLSTRSLVAFICSVRRSLSHVLLNSSLIGRHRAPVVAADQSAPGEMSTDHVDMTSLLAALQ